MLVQHTRRVRARLRYAIDSSACALSALVTIGLLPTLCDAQSASPTPQPEGVPITSEQTEPVTPENWAIHGQATFTPMFQPAFHSPYQGPLSLKPDANGRETTDVTLYLGFRPWQGAEIWINPEIDQGFGLSDTVGVAGFVSGEAYKVGEAAPYYVMPRAFFRQTIDLGGQTERLDSDLNQLGGTTTSNRLVFTVGKFSVVDIFDNNKYAHDPRNDFLNWSIVDMGSFDYAANAWGYTYGAAAEWYQDWWTVRVGLFDLSITPNSEYLDNRLLSQAQFVAELEERHELWHQPGKLKVLYWLTRGDLGTYTDALALAAATGQTPSTAAVRNYRSKAGIGLNLEQQLTNALGLFLRASIAQGDVEADDFTDISQSISGGISLAGSRWGRPGDTVGLGFAANQISHQAKQYFAAGGLGILVGDGQLPNAGPEQIVETYYSLAVFSFAHVTADYQFVNDPAYNRDRGPVSVFGLRLHAQF
ncbi:MAG TPA: carbohydrate porin [Rhodopila sp.]|nr:carbohydrate porin [Rhodopila sp.]